MKPENLIKYITWYATQNDTRLTTVRLVKFVYLADVYFARKHAGKTLTQFPWAFIYYGPYCREVMQGIENIVALGLIDKISYDSAYQEDKEYNIFICTDEDAEAIEEEIPIEVLAYLKPAIKRFGDDTALLLDHVYFETEPMIEVKKGDLLDFSKCQPLIPTKTIQTKKLSKEKIEAIRSHIKKLSPKFKHGRLRKEEERAETAKWRDEIYFQALEKMDEEDLETGLKGIAKIIK